MDDRLKSSYTSLLAGFLFFFDKKAKMSIQIKITHKKGGEQSKGGG